MNIIRELNKRGVNVSKGDELYIGYYETPNGVVVTRSKSKCTNGIYNLKNDKERIFPCNDHMIYITSGTDYDGKIKTKEEAERLVKDGKILSFKAKDLYYEYYNIDNDEDLRCALEYGYSSASKKYIELVMQDIGLIKYTDASNGSMTEEGNPTDFDIIYKYNLFLNAETEIGKIEQNVWIAQTCHQIEIDDFAVIKMYFSHKPSESDLRTAFAIRRFEFKPVEVFRCYECGRMVNWLELDGNIIEKYNKAEERYCGC